MCAGVGTGECDTIEVVREKERNCLASIRNTKETMLHKCSKIAMLNVSLCLLSSSILFFLKGEIYI